MTQSRAGGHPCRVAAQRRSAGQIHGDRRGRAGRPAGRTHEAPGTLCRASAQCGHWGALREPEDPAAPRPFPDPGVRFRFRREESGLTPVGGAALRGVKGPPK